VSVDATGCREHAALPGASDRSDVRTQLEPERYGPRGIGAQLQRIS
jgi:hypothetical protein